MATRSTIALEFADGTVQQVYCHWDGYLENNGQLLRDHYSDPFVLRDLLDLGAISSLRPTIGVQHSFSRLDSDMPEDEYERLYGDMCTFYARDRGENVTSAKKFKDFEDYLVPPAKFASLKQASELPLAVATDCNRYLNDRLTLLETQLATVNRMATANELPDAIITESGLKITPLDAAVPDTAQALIDPTAMILPHVKITELLLEVDEWTGFTRHFAHLKSGDPAKDKNLLLTTILADAINLGLTKMAESCPGTTYAKLAWLQAWHIRDETYGAALADLVNAQLKNLLTSRVLVQPHKLKLRCVRQILMQLH